MIGAALILRAIRDIAHGVTGSVRVVEQGTFRHYSGLMMAVARANGDLAQVQLPPQEQCAHLFDIELGEQTTSDADGTSARGNSRLSVFPLVIYVLSCDCDAVDTPEQPWDSLQFLGDVNDALDDLVLALGWPENLTLTADGEATGVVGGRLFGPSGDRNDDPRYKPGALTDCRRLLSQVRAAAIVQSAQEI